MFQTNINQKKKVNCYINISLGRFRAKNITRNKKDKFIMKKGSIH